MGRIWYEMGVIHWPLLVSVLAVVGLTVLSTARLLRAGARPDLRTKAWIDSILFWGGFALVAGVLGTLVGVIVAAQSIEMAGDIEPVLIWGGIKVAMSSAAAGSLILAIAALAWFFLQLRWRLLLASASEGTG